MPVASSLYPEDTPHLRKLRGAFFTPDAITGFVTDWAIRDAEDRVLEPSAGDAAFLVQAVQRLRSLGAEDPVVHGVEIHARSARVAVERVTAAGGRASIEISDFFQVAPTPAYSAVVGNPPYIRYQEFAGASRTKSREAALRAGVALTALASSWAAFTVHSALFLKPGGRMGLVLPAELFSVNYASAVRRFLFESFQSIELVMFEEQVFPEAEADVVLLLADGFRMGPAGHATVFPVRDASELGERTSGLRWSPVDPGDKWTSLLIDPEASEPLRSLRAKGAFTHLEAWGDTTLGMVTGNNRYFALSPARARELDLPQCELMHLSPPGSAHLRGLELTSKDLESLGRAGKSTLLFRPQGQLSRAAQDYVDAGHHAGVDTAYKCRVRKTWYEVPLLEPADLLLTCMNADTPRLTTNAAGARHLNSVHGVYLRDEYRELGRELLPLASLNSLTLLHAEVVGRSYGGGVLKLEPREADVWAMPSPALVEERSAALRNVRGDVAEALERRDLAAAVKLVDRALFQGSARLLKRDLDPVRSARAAMYQRRITRGKSGR
ncbi:N-6 DNA methylase [Demequina lutea]|uniref:Adenine-specific DNA methylase n=1 Tax=Demequina lutea TaxID=431489 RepID=A0A7Y9ZCK6_9MICO|nr:N-6 DNA methylase [Demequina lutea]NYI42879.1 adenine-specific DNA methylase [Demequina lutea]